MIRKKSMGPCIIWLTFLVVWLLMVQSSVFAEHGLRHDYPDVFAREDIRIESGQVIGSLLVAGANATVSGVVEKGIVVVDGNLLLTSEAHIKGPVIVLGGYVKSGDGARLEKAIMDLPPGKAPIFVLTR